MWFEMTSGGFPRQTLTLTLFAGSNTIEYTCQDRRRSRDLGDGLDTVSLKCVEAATIECTCEESGKVSETCTLRALTTKGSLWERAYGSMQILKPQ